jgi:hypothetical protein
MQTNTDRSPLADWSRFFRRKKAAAAAAECPHQLGRHLLRAAKSTRNYPDGNSRPAGLRGGRLVVEQQPCVWTPRHEGVHKTADGRTWS